MTDTMSADEIHAEATALTGILEQIEDGTVTAVSRTQREYLRGARDALRHTIGAGSIIPGE